MQMRTFTAKDIKTAMQLARDAMGDDAVLLSSEEKDGGVTATFAMDRADEDWMAEETLAQIVAPTIRPTQLAATALSAAQPASLDAILRHHAASESVMARFAAEAERLGIQLTDSLSDTTRSLAKVMASVFDFKPLPLMDDGFRLMFVGPPGAGKTITTAKIAAKMVVDNKPVRVITTDSRRAAGSDQLQAFTSILGLELEVADSGEALQAMLQNTDRKTRVVIDSASCNPYDFQELKELGEFATIRGIEPVLVCPAGVESGEAEEIAGVFSFLNIERVLISRTDCARRFGSALTVAHAGNYSFCDTTSSARAMGDLQPMSALMLATLLTQYQRDRMAA